MRKPVDTAGFQPPAQRALGRDDGGQGQADGVIDNEGALFGISLLLGLAFFGFGALSVLQGDKSRYR